MPENMSCVEAPVAQLSQFALVSYIPDPLGAFLDRLRVELIPGCSPRAHVTVLPPRPVGGDPDRAARQLQDLSTRFHGFEVELGVVDIFPVSKVIYLDLRRGERELREMYRVLNQGPVEYREPFPYHPHSTLAQNIPGDRVDHLFRLAQQRWAEYAGPRSFPVHSLDFVKNVYGTCWKDLASIELVSR
jgi:hypothetical protein